MNARLELALEQLKVRWERFEKFASEFLAVEFPDLRTVASASGDSGRDAELFAPVSDPTQVLQYSVTKDWAAKIRGTARRISETLPAVRLLIYVTSQGIGAKADNLKKEMRAGYQLFLDVRDRSYFLERYRFDHRTEAAAESLATDIVDPYLASKGVLSQPNAIFASYEARAAHLYLSLQFRDDAQEKGLTKLSFEALVRSVLLQTDSQHRMSGEEVRRKVRLLLPSDDPTRVDQLTDRALVETLEE